MRISGVMCIRAPDAPKQLVLTEELFTDSE